MSEIEIPMIRKVGEGVEVMLASRNDKLLSRRVKEELRKDNASLVIIVHLDKTMKSNADLERLLLNHNIHRKDQLLVLDEDSRFNTAVFMPEDEVLSAVLESGLCDLHDGAENITQLKRGLVQCEMYKQAAPRHSKRKGGRNK